MKLLSLCIPTFNRVYFLEQSLQAIVNSIPSGFQQHVEIVISDNCSTDKTQDLIATFVQKNLQMAWVIVRQETNIGPSNVTVVSKYATGKYVWILSDDDIVMPDALSKILELLETESPNGIIANYAPFKNDLQFLKKPVLPAHFTSDRASDIVAFLGSNITFLSILIFRRDLTQLPSGERGLSSLCQCYMFLDVISQHKIRYIPNAALAVRGHNSGGYDFFDVFVREFEEILKYASQKQISAQAIKIARAKNLFFILRFSISIKIRKNERFNIKKSVEIVYNFYRLSFLSILIIFILILPSFIFQFLFKFISK